MSPLYTEWHRTTTPNLHDTLLREAAKLAKTAEPEHFMITFEMKHDGGDITLVRAIVRNNDDPYTEGESA